MRALFVFILLIYVYFITVGVLAVGHLYRICSGLSRNDVHDRVWYIYTYSQYNNSSFYTNDGRCVLYIIYYIGSCCWPSGTKKLHKTRYNPAASNIIIIISLLNLSPWYLKYYYYYDVFESWRRRGHVFKSLSACLMYILYCILKY